MSKRKSNLGMLMNRRKTASDAKFHSAGRRDLLVAATRIEPKPIARIELKKVESKGWAFIEASRRDDYDDLRDEERLWGRNEFSEEEHLPEPKTVSSRHAILRETGFYRMGCVDVSFGEYRFRNPNAQHFRSHGGAKSERRNRDTIRTLPLSV
jgi:hypothetical protein